MGAGGRVRGGGGWVQCHGDAGGASWVGRTGAGWGGVGLEEDG